MTREQKFLSYRTHPYFKKLFKKLSDRDLMYCASFVVLNDKLSKGDFEKALNRAFLDTANKSKNWALIQELLSSANSGAIVTPSDSFR